MPEGAADVDTADTTLIVNAADLPDAPAFDIAANLLENDPGR